MSAVTRGGRVALLDDGREVVAWTRESVADRLAEAARTLKALPAAGCFPARLGAQWPEVVRGFWEVWNALEGDGSKRRFAEERNRAATTRVPPRGAAIDAMDEALGWLSWVADRRHVRLIWALALGIRPSRLARELGITRQTVNCWQREALESIVRRLNGESVGKSNRTGRF